MTDAPADGAVPADQADLQPRWIVLTPSVDHEAWLTVLAKAATAHGRTLAMVSAPASVDHPDQTGALYVTHDALMLDEIDPAHVTVIMPQPETAAEATGALYGLNAPHNAFQASMLLARAVSLGPTARLFTAAELARNPDEIELFPGFTVRPPIAERGSPIPIVSVALSLYRPGLPQPGASTTWSERLFIFDPRSCIEGTPLGVLDVSGRPRTLIYGPYLALPAGRWKAVMRFSVDADAATHELRFDWGHAGDFISQSVTPGTSGIYEIEMEHAVAGAVDLWQFRVLMMQGVFEGRMTFHGGTVTRLADAA